MGEITIAELINMTTEKLNLFDNMFSIFSGIERYFGKNALSALKKNCPKLVRLIRNHRKIPVIISVEATISLLFRDKLIV